MQSKDNFSQRVLAWRLRRRPRSFLDTLATRILTQTRLLNSTQVEYAVGTARILLPFDHPLPLYQRNFPLYDTSIGRLAALVEQKYPSSFVVDIGANVGDTAAAVRSQSTLPILCVDGNPEFSPYLLENIRRLGEKIAVECVMLAAEPGVHPGKIVTNRGTARIDASCAGSVECESLANLLARCPFGTTPRLLKIDTDGYDLPILVSALPTLQSTAPVLFFEHDPKFYTWDVLLAFRNRLVAAGYVGAVALRNTGEYDRHIDLRSQDEWFDLAFGYCRKHDYSYADVAAFSAADNDLLEKFRHGEISATAELREIERDVTFTIPLTCSIPSEE